MKKYILCSLIAAATLSVTSCNDDFLEYDPLVSQVPTTAFTTYDNFKTYAWGLYSTCFVGAAYDASLGNTPYSYAGPYDRGTDEVLFESGARSPWGWQTATKTTAPSDLNGNWSFSFIRQVNVMLDNIEGSAMNQTDKDHWTAVGYFFRAYKYSQLVANFGDVPWLEHEVKTTDTDIIYGPRTPRDEVTNNILSNLQWAEQHIKTEGEGKGTNSITVHAVRALISRFGLVEGTWRKYHQLGDVEKYLNASADASKKVIDAFPTVHGQYDALYNSESLSGVAGIILFNAFSKGQMYHNLSRYERTSAGNTEMSKAGVATYLTLNGLPVANASNQVSAGGQYYGDGDMFNEFRNRDRRLLYTVTPPYRVSVRNGMVAWSVVVAPRVEPGETYGSSAKVATEADSKKFSEYIDLMNTITSTARTTGFQYPAGITYTNLLPIRNWEGNGVTAVPHLNSYNEGRGFCVTRGGYYVYKYYNTSVDPSGQSSTNDLPIFRVGETMLNYAEAMYELGRFDQAVADLTINVLRPRAGVAPMNVAAINASFDPDRDKGGYSNPSDPVQITDYEVAPVLWEIRRERHVELMGDGFRFTDLKRWRKGHYMNTIQLGATVDNTDYNNSLAIWPFDINQGAKTAASNGQKGPIALAGDPVKEGKGWKWYYYFYPIPPTELALNPQLTQNPGWDQD